MKIGRFSEAQILGILKQADSGVPVSELCLEHAMSSSSFYKWRANNRCMCPSMITQIKMLDEENRRQMKMIAEICMQNELLKEVLGKIDRPS
jgi:putative transposase